MSVLSIVIPSYNMSPWLAVAIESCLWQTRGDMEIIVLDRSTDNSPEIVDAYARADTRVRYVAQKSVGLGPGRQEGQEAATGDYVTWLDADDFLAPNAVEEWLGTAERDNADMVCANAVAFSDRTFNARRYFYHTPAACMTFDAAPAYWKSKVVWRWIFSLPFIREHDLSHPEYKFGQDVCFMYSAFLRTRCFSQCAPFLYYFRQEHKSAFAPLDVQVEHALAHFIEVRKTLVQTPDGVPRIKALVKYLNEKYWRDVRKVAPQLVGDDARYMERVLALGLELFEGLDPAWFRAAALAPEVREEKDFLPLVDAFTARDTNAARAVIERLRDTPRHAPDKENAFHTLRHRIKAAFNPLSRTARTYLRDLEGRARRRFPNMQ